jgi:thioredoxin-related protein
MMRIKYILCLIFWLSLAPKIEAQNQSIAWLNSLQLADSMRAKPKKILINIHTSWCHYCKMQEKQTFENKEVIKQTNENFYAFSFDAESKDDLYFAGKTYRYKASGRDTGLHELATFLATQHGQIAYPTVLVLSEKFELLYRNTGFVAAKDLLKVIALVNK